MSGGQISDHGRQNGHASHLAYSPYHQCHHSTRTDKPPRVSGQTAVHSNHNPIPASLLIIFPFSYMYDANLQFGT